MKTLIRLLVVSCMFAVASTANATTHWVYGTTVKTAYPYSSGSGSYVLTFSTSDASCTNTGSPDKNFYVGIGQVNVDINQAKEMLALVLYAKAMSVTVDYAYDDATSYCYISQMILH